MRIRCADGTYRWIESTAVPLFDQQAESPGGYKGLIGISMDITDLMQAEQELREADQRKDQFLATLAHELRNPLAPIRNAVHILRTRGADPAIRKLQDIIDRQSGQLARMVDDLLDVSRISRGKLELRTDRVTLQQVIQGAVETSRPLIDQGGHRLEVSMPEEPVVLEGDLTRLSQVFANLLNNAAKFTDASGHIKLVAEVQGAEVAVSVIDRGYGIPPAQMANIFDLFCQGEGQRRQVGGGLGIGLSIVKQLVELHHGRVTAKSDGAGHGSEFTVHLPLAVDQHPGNSSSDEAAASSAPPAKRLRILVVDDSEDAALTLATFLELAGYELHLAHDGEQALVVADACRPDVVLLDIGLPKLSGNEVCRRLRGQDWGRRMAIIALTGWGQEQDRRRTTESGFDHHLVKPADPNALLQLLETTTA
jgi:signal transduction histidine kinase/CheY-like chemotaxis protein